jgi:hypothetical protein
MLAKVMNKIQSVLTQQEVQKNLGWMNTLPEMNILDALKETTNQLARIKFDDGKNLKNQIALILEIDAKSYRSAKKLARNYMIILNIDKSLERETYDAVYLYQRQLFLCYTQFLEAYSDQKKALVNTEKLTLVFGRLLSAAFAMAKWRYFDDQPAPVGTWMAVHKVIRYAEKLAVMNKNFFLYNHQKKETSIASILKQGFMLDTLHKGNYTRLQIQLTEYVLKAWSTNPLIVNKFKQDKYQFFINVEEDRGPERVRTVEKFAQYRFWKTTRLVDLIEAYLCAVNTGKSLDEFGLEKVATPAVLVKLFKKLRVDWCVEGYERQRRGEARNKSGKLLNVCYGLEDICSRLDKVNAKNKSKTADGANFDFEMKVAMQRSLKQESQINVTTFGSENWWMVDESSNGFAVDLGKEVSSWIEPGKLVGYSANEDTAYMVAEVKNLRKQPNGTYRLGMQVITETGTAIRIARLDQTDNVEALSGYFVDDSLTNFGELNTFFGLMMPKSEKTKVEKTTLIIPRAQYKRGAKYKLAVNGVEKIFTIGSPLTKQRDWVSVVFPI